MASYGQVGMRPGMAEDEVSASRMMEEEPVAAPERGWVVDDVRIKRSKNDGWIVSTSKHKPSVSSDNSGPGAYELNDYTFTSLAEAVPFIESEFGASAASGAGAVAGPTVPSTGM